MYEIYKQIKGYEGLYEISNLGNVKSSYTNTILKPNKTNNGYLLVHLFKNKKVKAFSIHRLVGLHFIENKENKPCINHKDYNKENNCVDNLEWCSQQENCKWSREHYRQARIGQKASEETCKRISMSNKGRKSWNEGLKYSNEIRKKMSENSKIKKSVIAYDKEGNRLNQFESLTKCANFYNISKTSVCDVLKGKVKTCKGLVFAYGG